ncbi:MAG: SPFH domain-containing protein [Planctomycetota bacterium]
MKVLKVLIGVAALALLLVMSGAFYSVHETDIVILTQFGRPVGDPVTEPGLHFKTPFVQEVNRLEKRVLEFDGPPTEMPTKDKTYIVVDTFARWRIGDPAKFFVALRDERSAQSRLEDIIGSELRQAVASHELIEVVRSDVTRTLPAVAQVDGAGATVAQRATSGRRALQQSSPTSTNA